MPLIRTPLFAAHAALGAQFLDVHGWALPGQFRTVEEEVAAASRQPVMLDLAAHTPITLAGPDVRRFCNGMFTQNVRDMAIGATARSALTDEKGKMLGLISITRIAEFTMLVLLDGISAAAFCERYEKFIILDDIEMENLFEQRTVLHIAGPGAGEALVAVGLPIPAAGMAAGVESVWVLRRDRIGLDGYDLVVPSADVVALFEALRGSGVMPIGHDASEWLRISAGQAQWPDDMGERALVHEMNLVPICCSFEKGCYVGQEVINRIDVMGQVTKKLVRLNMVEDAIPPLGAEIKLGDELVGSARSGARCGGKSCILAVIRKAAWAAGTELTVHADGRVVRAVVA